MPRPEDKAPTAEAALAESEHDLCRMARVVQSRHGRDLDLDELVQVGRIRFLEMWDRATINPRRYALKSAEGAMMELIRHSGYIFDGAPSTEPSRSLPRYIRRAIRSLPRNYRDVLMPWLARTPDKEIALNLGCSVTAVQTRRHRAIAKLIRKLSGQDRRKLPGRTAKHNWKVIDRALDEGASLVWAAFFYKVDIGVIRNHRYRRAIKLKGMAG